MPTNEVETHPTSNRQDDISNYGGLVDAPGLAFLIASYKEWDKMVAKLKTVPCYVNSWINGTQAILLLYFLFFIFFFCSS